ncbi:unnamed protein product [Caenorhabditis auriculariae]|uniref:Uncharacterized protein n=1 Tax=Caenorhabditis auriculariae TaxID=2777116 RepID=A0A8S1HQB4_9PELO|nr:unnamed protein product [Caenorhabditis auriculariae]
MRRSLLMFVLLSATVSEAIAGPSRELRERRDNKYGDELVTPASNGRPSPALRLQAEVPIVTIAPQGGGAQVNVATSGYQK